MQPKSIVFKDTSKLIERNKGIEPSYPAWKAGIITVILIPHIELPPCNDQRMSVYNTEVLPIKLWKQIAEDEGLEPPRHFYMT